MKKPLIIGVSALVLLASATLLFAQTATGSSLITEMKAAVRVFTLAGDLNPPGTTGLQSAPVSGKKTGDMLTAGEWNRILELAAQGGGGGGGGGAGFEVNDTTTKTRYSIIWNGISWANNPKHLGGLGGDSTGLTNCGTYFAGTLTPNCKMIETAAHDFCQIVFAGGAVTHSELNYIGAKKWRIITSGFGNFTSGTIVECYDNIGGGTGTGGGGSGWVDVPLTDTNPFDQQCMYRFVTQGQTYYAETVHEDKLYWINSQHFTKTNKSVLVFGTAPYNTATKMEKFCGGGGGGGGFNWDQCTTEWVGTPTNGTPYTNAAGLKCKYTGTGPGAPGTNYYYLCCPGA